MDTGGGVEQRNDVDVGPVCYRAPSFTGSSAINNPGPELLKNQRFEIVGT